MHKYINIYLYRSGASRRGGLSHAGALSGRERLRLRLQRQRPTRYLQFLITHPQMASTPAANSVPRLRPTRACKVSALQPDRNRPTSYLQRSTRLVSFLSQPCSTPFFINLLVPHGGLGEFRCLKSLRVTRPNLHHIRPKS